MARAQDACAAAESNARAQEARAAAHSAAGKWQACGLACGLALLGAFVGAGLLALSKGTITVRHVGTTRS
ncbi:hypothetical protein C2E20_1791 [Micractinium conductrix]|uniref:Uncharacterized protein n=1 Tax=Micractinium conductrix TaxID=554055 RepID=A0A2P6VM38_9CHLO|nr:hypothetical protein C2E20_1791 [Micractinium conductrix]|eukprot:PSC75150.1 hypothetical protein C2E20_1791 [Micractinium conductrix]